MHGATIGGGGGGGGDVSPRAESPSKMDRDRALARLGEQARCVPVPRSGIATPIVTQIYRVGHFVMSMH